MQSNIRCTARRLTCDAPPQSIATKNDLRRLGFKSCVRGTQLGTLLPNRNNCLLTQSTLPRRGHATLTQAFVVPPALVRIAQKVVFRGASGRLLLETAKKGGWKFSAPLAAALFVYSVVATWFAARQTKELAKITDSIATIDEDGTMSTSFLATSPENQTSETNAPAAAPLSSATSSPRVAPGADACPICHGRGTITWDRFDVHEGALCPRCLGTGSAKKKTTFFGK